MEIGSFHISITDASGVGECRRSASELARLLGFSEEETGRVALVTTELATNQIKHAGGGEVLLQATPCEPCPYVDIVAIDKGPGIVRLAEAMSDGVSTAGSPGTGLGAVTRLASRWDLYTKEGVGTVAFASIAACGARASPSVTRFGALNVPVPGETVSGDAWSIHVEDGRTVLLVADGLGHGYFAREAARAAQVQFQSHWSLSPAEIVGRIHDALRATRGAAVTVTEVDARHGVVRHSGLGNVAATILRPGHTRSLVSSHGTAGHNARHIQEFSYPWSSDAVLVVNSDGLMTQWSLDAYPGILQHDPILAAAVLYRDFRRGRDDASVVVVRENV